MSRVHSPARVGIGLARAVSEGVVALHESSSYRFARVNDQALAWQLRRNCSVTPRQLGATYASLCLVSLAIALWCWVMGAKLVLGFTVIVLLVVGLALLTYARHAVDGETVRLQDGCLIVERECGGGRERMEFRGAHVRIDAPADRRALIEVRAHGRRVEIGRHVRPEWRPALAGEMRQALRASGHAAADGSGSVCG